MAPLFRRYHDRFTECHVPYAGQHRKFLARLPLFPRPMFYHAICRSLMGALLTLRTPRPSMAFRDFREFIAAFYQLLL